ncbi:hypothetical protein ACH5RR_023231 [Cinchona calisaya]|uniref:Uncharacterized protein n=1 Tax=Cinchona calisaya TaxID=153742 RepID=A0ABD2ZA24_9GENT
MKSTPAHVDGMDTLQPILQHDSFIVLEKTQFNLQLGKDRLVWTPTSSAPIDTHQHGNCSILGLFWSNLPNVSFIQLSSSAPYSMVVSLYQTFNSWTVLQATSVFYLLGILEIKKHCSF